MGGRTVKLSDKLFKELKRRKGKASFNKFIEWLWVREKDRLGERDKDRFPELVVDYDDVASLGRAGVPDGVIFRRERRRDAYGVPINE